MADIDDFIFLSFLETFLIYYLYLMHILPLIQ